MVIQEVPAKGVRLSVWKGATEIGHAFVYIMHNDLHTDPFALLEDVAVSDGYRGSGAGNELVVAAIAHARREGCYKLIATSRTDGTRLHIHDWYKRLGFADHGIEFRMDF